MNNDILSNEDIERRYIEIATDFSLWRELFDTEDTWELSDFDGEPVESKVALLKKYNVITE